MKQMAYLMSSGDLLFLLLYKSSVKVLRTFPPHLDHI